MQYEIGPTDVLIRQCEGLWGQVVCQEKRVRGFQPKKSKPVHMYQSNTFTLSKRKTPFTRMYQYGGVICYDLATLCIFKSKLVCKAQWDATVLSYFKIGHFENDSKKKSQEVDGIASKEPKIFTN